MIRLLAQVEIRLIEEAATRATRGAGDVAEPQ